MKLQAEAPLYAPLELAAPSLEGQLPAGPWLDPEVGGDKSRA